MRIKKGHIALQVLVSSITGKLMLYWVPSLDNLIQKRLIEYSYRLYDELKDWLKEHNIEYHLKVVENRNSPLHKSYSKWVGPLGPDKYGFDIVEWYIVFHKCNDAMLFKLTWG